MLSIIYLSPEWFIDDKLFITKISIIMIVSLLKNENNVSWLFSF